MMARRLASAAVVALALPAIAQAQTETRIGAVASANVGYSNNPFAQFGGIGTGASSGSGYAGIGIRPTLQFAQERSTITLSGDAQFQKYFKDYPNNENYRASLDYVGTPTARLRTHARIDAVSAIIGSYGAFDPIVIGPTTPGGGTIVSPGDETFIPPGGEVGAPIVNDIGLFGTRDRRRSLRGSADFGYALTERDAINGSGYGELSRYNRFGDIADYNAYGGTLGYSHQVSQNVRLGVQGSYSQFNYDAARGDSQVYSVQGTLFARLNDRWTANARLGTTFVNGGGLGSTRSNSISGGLNLCRRGTLSSLCLDASRDVRPTGLNGAQYINVVGLTWSSRLSERDILSASASYSREGRSQNTQLVSGRNEYARATLGYERRLGERLSLTASVNYRDIFGGGPSLRADYGGRVGVAYRIGDPR